MNKINNNALNKIEQEIKQSRKKNVIDYYKMSDGTVDYDALRKKLIDNISPLIEKVCIDNTKEEKQAIKIYLKDNIFKIKDLIYEETDDIWQQELKDMVNILKKEYLKRYHQKKKIN